jgi:hypothetical protein
VDRWGFEPAFVAGELVGRGVQGVEGRVPQLAGVNHCPGVQRHRIGERPDDHSGCQRPFGQGQDRPALGP